jgi:hypothetical protein
VELVEPGDDEQARTSAPKWAEYHYQQFDAFSEITNRQYERSEAIFSNIIFLTVQQ